MSAVFTRVLWQPDDYILFRKCGEITISPDIQNIGFNCLFCTGICLQSDIFLQHLQEQHKEDIFKLYEQQQNVLFSNSEFQNLNKQDILMQNNLKLNSNNEYTLNMNTEENCIMLNMLTPTEVVALTSPPTTTDLNLLYDLQNNDLLTLTSSQELENLITSNPLENLTNTSNLPYTLLPSTNPALYLKCAPDDSECEIGDGEDSGIMLVQSPCTSVSGGFSDCMSFTEDSSSKSTTNFDDNWQNPTVEFEKQHTESDLRNSDEPHEDATKPTKAKEKYMKSPAISKALKNKDLISYLIKAYRKNEKLWNPSHPSYIYNARRTIYNELSKPLLQDMNYSLNGNEIFAIINELRGRYRRELTKFHVRKGKHKTRLWYFEQMEFLHTIIKEKRKERTKVNEIANTDVLDKNITNRQVLSYLLHLYKNFECLWNPNDSEYMSCNKSEVYEEISMQLQDKFKLNITDKDCLNEIQKLRIRYRKELRILHKLKGLYITKLWCFDEMEFLRPIMEEKIIKNLKKNICHTANQFSQGKHDFLKAENIKFKDLEQQLQFIEIYRNYSSLWDVDHPDYRSTNYRNKALKEMLQEVNLRFSQNKIEFEQLEKTIYQMRKDFSAEKQKRLIINTKSVTNSDATKLSLLLYEKLSEFLTLNLGPFRCDDCQQICKTYDQYKIHLSKHDGNLPFICTLCGKGFQMAGNLTIHIRRHRRDFPYSCEFCKKSFATSTEVSIHMRSHTGERPYICDFCDKTFKTWSFFDIHKRTHLKQSNFHCPICDKSFYERNRFTDHMNVHLNIRKHQCEQCGKGFTTYGNLKKHLELHAPIKKYKCQPCDKSFAQFASLRWHRKAQHKMETQPEQI